MERPLADELTAVVQREMARWTVPGLAVGLLRDGVRDTRAFGVTSLATGYPLLPESVFRVASISKLFTATLAMTLVQEGKIGLDTPIIEYLPDLPLADAAARRVIALRHLLSHQSGLWGDFAEDHGLGEEALARAIARFGTIRQMTPPGECWAYCNAGFHLTGALIQRVLGVPFETAMRERIFAPLGLRRTGYFAHEALVHSVAVGHDPIAPGSDAHKVAAQYYPRNRNPAGGIISCIDDLLAFAAMYLGGGETAEGSRVLSAATIAAMWTPQIRAGNFADAYGLGWALRTIDGGLVAGHGGSVNGYQSQLIVVPDRRFALVVLTNSGRGSAAIRGLEDWALERYCGLHAQAPTTIALPDDELARYAGRYERPNEVITIGAVENGLRVDTVTREPGSGAQVAWPTQSLRPLGAHQFIVEGGESAGSRVEFLQGDGGPPRFVRLGGRLADRV